jgi:hypothetical protein
MATRLNDNFRRKSQEKEDNYQYTNFQKKDKPKRHPDEMDWKANATFRKKKRRFRKKGFQKNEKSPVKTKEKYFNCGKNGHFAKKYRLSKVNNAEPDTYKEKRGRKI